MLSPAGLCSLAVILSLLIPRADATTLVHIRVVDGERAVHTAASKSNRGLLVEITDETGKPLEGAAVSFRLPEDGPGGTFSRGTRTEIQITGPDGRAGFRELVAGRMTGPFQIRVTAAKDSIRAGTIVDQYVSEPVKGSAAKSLAASGAGSSGSRKWLLWLAVGGGAAAAAIAAGSMGHGTSATTSAPAPATQPPTIGVPVITIGGGK